MATICPHCGKKIYALKKPRKRRRLPNGFGSITEIKGRNLKKPFLARVSIGKDPEGKPILRSLRPISYFSTYNDAYAALLEYNMDTFDLSNDITLKELYDLWMKTVGKNKDIKYKRTKNSYFEYLKPYYDRKIGSIRVKDIKHSIQTAHVTIKRGKNKGDVKNATNNTKKIIKELWNQLFDFALEKELVPKNYARTFKLPTEMLNEIKEESKSHMLYTENEIIVLWKHVDLEAIALTIVQCYSGWRPSELCQLKTDNVNITNWSMKGGLKTAGGKNRVLPIHSAIQPIIENYYKKAILSKQEYLFGSGDKPLPYNTYLKRFKKALESVGLSTEHKLHDARKYFITEATRSKIDSNIIKRFAGHYIGDVTEAFYVERDLEWFREEIEKIKVPVYK